jgi:hypothetical protein
MFPFAVVAALAASAQAVVTTTAQFHIGETDLVDDGDADALENNPATNGSVPGSALDAAVGTDASIGYSGTATFSNNAAPGSSLALNITGGGSSTNRAYSAPPNLSPAFRSDNWGVEAWLYFPSANDGNSDYLAYSVGYFNFQAWEVQKVAGVYNWLFSPNNVSAYYPIAANDYDRWVHTAVVVDGGVHKYYLDGALLHSYASGGASWSGNALYDDLWIGTANNYGGNFGWQGGIDEVRVFQFDPGQFDPSDLSFVAAANGVPEPSTYALGLIGLAGLGLLAWRKNRIANC